MKNYFLETSHLSASRVYLSWFLEMRKKMLADILPIERRLDGVQASPYSYTPGGRYTTVTFSHYFRNVT